jgi:hypothetical protein
MIRPIAAGVILALVSQAPAHASTWWALVGHDCLPTDESPTQFMLRGTVHLAPTVVPTPDGREMVFVPETLDGHLGRWFYSDAADCRIALRTLPAGTPPPTKAN